MTSWGLVATVRAPVDHVLAFIAHHLSLGADHLWVCFDDPDDPAFARVEALPKGTLSHSAGKSFCRPGVPGIELRLHAVALRGERLEPPPHPDLRLLHFHAQDHDAWRRALPFRLDCGAYQYNAALQTHLTHAGEAELVRFYQTTQTLTPEYIRLLEAPDRLVTADLGLKPKVRALMAGTLG
ncbi:MAG: hypothetical protein C0524_06505 [Rhodobacter sp.]|nr:hypothetical protein [Rhodobacter sp.]